LSGLRIRYSAHALERMIQRRITRELIEETINHPDQVFKGRFNRMVTLRHKEEKTLKVIFEENSEIHIVTAYWIRRKRVA
jgi:uncharacterized protein DUF4258